MPQGTVETDSAKRGKSQEVSFYFDTENPEAKQMYATLTEQEVTDRAHDYQMMMGSKLYRKRFEDNWARAATIYNVIQEGTPDDRVSNIFIGLARMIIDAGISMMTEGEPDFDFSPIGPSDYKKVILWKSAMKMVMNQCNFKSHQNRFITDFHVFGTGVLDVYTQMPYRTKRYEDKSGTIQEKIVRDFRKTKVGVRHVSPWHAWRNPNILDPDEVPTAGREFTITWNKFVEMFGRAFVTDANGKRKPKYKNIDQIPKRTHVKVTICQDEIQDVYRIYVLPYHGVVEGETMVVPTFDLGIPIFDKPLSINRVADQNTIHETGVNVPGMTTMCFAPNVDIYDLSGKTHAVYGMGIPYLIEGPDQIMQAFSNMHVDNWRLANTVALSYKPYDGTSFLDLDNEPFYSGHVINGEMVATPFGQVRTNDFGQAMEWLNQLCVWITGINFQQLNPENTPKTAFQFAQQIRMNNQRAQTRIRTLENGCLKRMGTLLLSNILSELTVEEWEELTEDQVENIAKQIDNEDTPAEDYKFESGKPTHRRVHVNIPVEGRKLRESFKKTKKRKLDYNADLTKEPNTLIEDKSMEGNTSYVPATKEYLYPAGYIEYGLLPDVLVDGKTMLGDQKAQDMQGAQQLWQMGIMAAQLLPDIDFQKQYDASAKIAGFDPKDFKKDEDKGSELMQAGQQAQDNLMNQLAGPLQQGAQAPQMPQGGPQQVQPPAMPQVPQGTALDQVANQTL
jgi:hypothetical protein